jgi:hypothetical protein
MDEVVGKLETLTLDFVQTLDTTDADSIVAFVEQRQMLIDEFQRMAAEYKDVEGDDYDPTPHREKLQNVLSYDAMINEKMNQVLSETRTQLVKMNQSRKRDQAYNHYYATDAVYFDKKK